MRSMRLSPISENIHQGSIRRDIPLHAFLSGVDLLLVPRALEHVMSNVDQIVCGFLNCVHQWTLVVGSAEILLSREHLKNDEYGHDYLVIL